MRRPSPRPLISACALALAVGAVVLAPARLAHADGIDAKQKQVEAALKAASSDLDDATSATARAAADLSAVQAQLTAAQTALAADQAQLTLAQQAEQAAAQAAATAQATLAQAQAARDTAQQQVDAQQQAIEDYAVAAYEAGATTETLALVTLTRDGGDPAQIVARVGMLDEISRGQARALTAYEQVRVALTNAETVVAQRTRAVVARQQEAQAAVARVAAITTSARATTTRLASLTAQRGAVLAHAEAVLAVQRSQVAQLTAESDQIAALIRARASTGSGVIGRGGLLWPAAGPVTSPFGYRLDPVTGKYALHAGVDIGAPEGADIHAAKAGTVIFAGQETGYGNYTCIDHGGGFSTCYAHQSLILVRVGQVVTQGQVIGHVGHTGYATGPHLHFETRVNGNPVDPMQYF